MELRQLRFVVMLAEELNFRRAAERMHIAQPAFSEQIRRLESELGARLFERTSHYVRLTDAGELFLSEIRPALDQVERAAAVAARAGRGMLGSITVGFTCWAANELTSLILRDFSARHPAVSVDLREFGFADPSAGLARREVDVAFLRLPVPGQCELAIAPLFDEPYVAVMASDHRLADAPSLCLEDILREPFVLGPRETGIGDRRRAGPVANTTEEWLWMIAAGCGISLTPESAERFHGRPGLRFVPVTGIRRSTVAIAYHREKDAPVVRAFVEASRTAARRSAGSPLAAIA